MVVKVGDEIKMLELEVSKYTPYFYAGASGDFNPIHIDNEFAKEAGLSGIILQGLCTMAFVYRAAMSDKDPQKIKKLKVRFANVVRPKDRLTITGKLIKEENNLLTFELSALNQSGKQVINNASCVIER